MGKKEIDFILGVSLLNVESQLQLLCGFPATLKGSVQEHRAATELIKIKSGLKMWINSNV